MLTADEIAFAVGALSKSNSTYYIKGNTNSSFWWALSPNDFNGNKARVWGVIGDFGVLGYGLVSKVGGVWPSLSLNSGVEISTSGIGSATNPYKIAA